MAVKNASWLSQTEQHWKVWVFLFMIALSLSFFVLFVWRVNVPSPAIPALPDQGTLSFCFVMSGIVSLGWLWLSVRCPVCNAKVAAHILKPIQRVYGSQLCSRWNNVHSVEVKPPIWIENAYTADEIYGGLACHRSGSRLLASGVAVYRIDSS